MRRNYRITLWVMVAVGIAAAGLAAQSISTPFGPEGRKSPLADRPPSGTFVRRPTEDILKSGAMAMLKTINISPAAFTTDGISRDYYIWMAGGFLQGQPTGSFLCAPVLFPKGAKKIVSVDVLVWNSDMTNQLRIVLYANPWSDQPPTALFDFTPDASPGWQAWSWAPAKAAQPPIIPTDNYSISLWLTDYAALKSIIITYK